VAVFGSCGAVVAMVCAFLYFRSLRQAQVTAPGRALLTFSLRRTKGSLKIVSVSIPPTLSPGESPCLEMMLTLTRTPPQAGGDVSTKPDVIVVESQGAGPFLPKRCYQLCLVHANQSLNLMRLSRHDERVRGLDCATVRCPVLFLHRRRLAFLPSPKGVVLS
jgi:hypothetical protein